MNRKGIFLLGIALLMASCTNLQNNSKHRDAAIEIVDESVDDGFVDAVIDIMNENEYKQVTKESVTSNVLKSKASDNKVKIDSTVEYTHGMADEAYAGNEDGEFSAQETVAKAVDISDDDKGVTNTVLNGIDEYDILDKKMGNDKIAYLKGKSTPFTGTFVSFIGLHRSYSEKYVDGRLNGKKIWYAEDGSVGVEEPYVNNRRHGTQVTYHLTNKKVRSKINYVNGRLEGNVEWYDVNGNLIDKRTIKNGTGTWVSYSTTGKLREKGEYKNFRRDGKWERYTEDGVLEKIDYYKNGSLSKREWHQ